MKEREARYQNARQGAMGMGCSLASIHIGVLDFVVLIEQKEQRSITVNGWCARPPQGRRPPHTAASTQEAVGHLAAPGVTNGDQLKCVAEQAYG
jgi:hypothetical protein